ncbi:hypothetical protein D3876_02515 [Sphingomonas cavernae]|uniref:Lytic transglycosylase domain-containing protein n=1 Tax=Sphingomonas cavernae TaxID=2320861 RepID=A0A418WSF8_9SPHN|nr:hypothetical protein D3876_02515 [Sphingomonas cavernae]
MQRTAQPSRVHAAISRAAQRTGVDFDYLWNQARVESSLDPGAKAPTSSASGLYQFIEQSWLGVINKHGAAHGYGWAADQITQRGDGRYVVSDPDARRAILALRYDPDAAAVMAGEFAADNADTLSGALGRHPNATDLYFAHFLGAGGASRFLRAAGENPDASAAALFPREAGANRSIFYHRSGASRSLGEVYALMARKLGTDSEAPAAPMGEPGLRLTRTLPGEAEDASPRTDALSAPLVTAMAERTGFDVLRPNPQSARLAYMMVVSTLDG